jgi:apolipoprotein N-acyltransferase
MARKQGADMGELLDTQVEITRNALAERTSAGLPPPDAVVWAETMLPIQVLAPGVAEAIEAGGVELAPWHGEVRRLLMWPKVERDVVHSLLLERTLPPQTALLAGVEEWVVVDGRVRRTNVGALWQRGSPRQSAPKTFLVIGGETSYGLDDVGFVRDFASSMAGYIPDLLAGERTEVLDLAAGARTFHLATTVCFDNAFMRPYTEPLLRERVDAHVVVSNEAWYRASYEFDQMMAFTKIAAAASGRAIARSTNSGVSALVGPDGRELARLEVDGRDREVAGSLAVVVPVPVRAAGGSLSDDRDLAPPFVRLGPFGTRALALLALAAGPLLCFVRRRPALETAR